VRRFFNHRGHRGHGVCCCRHASNDFAASFALNKGLLQQHRSRAGKPELHQFVSIRVHSCPFVVQNHPHRAQKKGHFEQSLEMPLCCSLGPAGFEPATKGLCFPLRLSPPFSGSWSGPSLHAACSGRALAVSAVWPLHLPPPKQRSWKSPLFQSRLGSGLAYRLKPARWSDLRRCSVPRI